VVCIFNFTERWTAIDADWTRARGAMLFRDALSQDQVDLDAGRIALPPYARLWLR
jgi:amylosucrase